MIKSETTPSPTAQKILKTLITKGLHPLQWWEEEISSLFPENRHQLLNELAIILSQDKYAGVSGFAKSLNIDKTRYSIDFESVLFDLLMPLHRALIQRGKWDEALNLENIIYQNFIKQDESHDFYERAFSELYSPYTSILKKEKSTSDTTCLLKESSNISSNNAILFWFQNYYIFAHTELVLELAKSLPIKAQLYASALKNDGFENSQKIFTQAGIEILKIDDQQSYSMRCHELIMLCKSRGVKNIALVSLPLQSGYLKKICEGITLAWWCMKFPLGCMTHFDRLVCNNTLYPTQKIFQGTHWQCAPFALKGIVPHINPQQPSMNQTDLKIGILAREEKFSSSYLPEILNRCLIENPSIALFWTGRNEDINLVRRLGGPPNSQIHKQIHFVGWVDPNMFLNQIDLLVDTPNLGGLAAYWAMSIGKVVISATDSGSVGVLGTQYELRKHFNMLTSADEVHNYFNSEPTLPYYLSNTELIAHCLSRYANQKRLLKKHGQHFLNFFTNSLSDMRRYSEITYRMLSGTDLN